MKQYLHTIMRSLCIMLMLCGISNGAWAQSEYFDGSGTSQDPFIVNNGNFKYLINYCNNKAYYFRKKGTIALHEAPTYSLPSFNFVSEYEQRPINIYAEYPSEFIHLFKNEWFDSKVYYYYHISIAEQWGYLVRDFTNNVLPSNKYTYLKLTFDSFTLTEFPEQASVADKFWYSEIANDCGVISVGTQEEPISFKAGMNPLMTGSLGDHEEYYFSVTNENWDDFALSYKNFTAPERNVRFILEDDIELSSEQVANASLDITPSNFDLNGHTITVGTEGSPVDLPTTFNPLFSNSDLENNVTYYFSVTNENWSKFASIYSSLTNANFSLTQNIILSGDKVAGPSLAPNNFDLNSHNITVGEDSNPVDLPTTFNPLFSKSDLENNVTYYFSVTKENWNKFVSIYNDFTNANYSLGEVIALTSAPDSPYEIQNDRFSLGENYIVVGSKEAPLEMTSELPAVFNDTDLQGGVKYYYSITKANWDDAVSFYSNISDDNKSNVYLVATDSNIEFGDFPSNMLAIEADNLIGNPTISVGSPTSPIGFTDGFTHVFYGELDSNVKYYFLAESDTWNDFVNYYYNLSEKSNVYLVMTENFELTSTPDNSLDIDNDHFINNGHKIKFFESFDVFADSGMNESYVDNGAWTVTQDNWSDFISALNNNEIDDNASVTFSGEIVISDSNMPSSSISLNNITFDDGCTIIVGSEDSPVTIPSPFYTLFENNDADIVKYYYEITGSNWDDAVSFYNELSNPSNVYLVAKESAIELGDFPSNPLTIATENFIGSPAISVGSSTSPISFTDGFTHVFDGDLESDVKYYFLAENDTWNDFVNYYNYSSEKSNVYLVMTGNFELTSTPNYALDIDGDHFIDNGYKISISDSFDVFADSGMNESYVDNGDWTVTQDNWSDFISALTNNEIKDNAPITFSGEIVISDSDMPENSISHNNITFEDNCTITVGSEGSPISTFPSTFISLFNSDDAEKYVKYYYEITEDNWDDAVSFYNGLSDNISNVYLVANSPIEFDDFPENTLDISEENFICSSTISVGTDSDPVDFPSSFTSVFENKNLEAQVSYYIDAYNDGNWDGVVSFYNDLEEADKNRVNLMLTGDLTLSDFPSATLDITSDNFYFNNSSSIIVGDSDNPVNISGYIPVFADNTLNSGVKYSLEIDSQDGMNYYLENASALSSECTIYLDNNGDAVDCWYDYDMSSIDFSGSSTTIIVSSTLVSILLSDKSTGHEPFVASTDQDSYGSITYLYTPSNELVNILFHNALSEPGNRGTFFTEHENEDGHSIDVLFDKVGHGTQSYPYQIYTYEMLEKLVKFVNAQDEDYTNGMYIQLAADINAQDNERLTDVDGSIKLDEYKNTTIQFSGTFKGHFDGLNHSISGLTNPLFANLSGAEIKNLGIVDCNMTGHALASSATSSTVTMSYVSGVSNGLISETNNTVTNCYAYNPSKSGSDAYTEYSLTAKTVQDISKTHNILKDNCYKLDSKYSDCTLFIPEDNTFYSVYPSDFFKWESGNTETYMYYINWGDDFVWVDNPAKSNVSMLHNVVYRDGWLNNNNLEEAVNIGGLRSLDYLYSWYIVDKKPCNTSAIENGFGMNCRVNNIYYSRNNSTTSSPAPDGLNTIYLPFAWNPATDIFDKDGNLIDDAEVYILADKLNGDEFDDNALYKDYSMENSLLFFDPAKEDVSDGETRYDDFAGVSNALPTILNIPSGKDGWYIKRSGLANYLIPRGSDGEYDKTADNAAGLDNLYNNYWEDKDHADASNQKIGRSFMEIDRLGKDWENSNIDHSSYESYTRTVHYTCEDKSSAIYICETKKQIYKTDKDQTVAIFDSNNGDYDYYIYKANENGDIAIDGSDKDFKILQIPTSIIGNEKSLKIYQAGDDGNIAYIEDSEDPVRLYETTENDIIYLDDEFYPARIYLGSQQINIISRDSESMSGEVVSGVGDFSGKVVIVDESNNYPVEPYSVYTAGNDRIVLDNKGYPKEVVLERASTTSGFVKITLTRNESSITGTVISGDDGSLKEGDKVVIEDEHGYYPLQIYVCGGHEEDEDCTWDGSDFPGRAYHLGTFTGIAAGKFANGKYNDYSCYKLNSAGDGFAKVTSNSSVQPFRTFLAIAPAPDPNADSSSGAKALKFGVVDVYDGSESGATEIDGVPTEGIHLMTTDESKIYSIDGRYVGQYGNKKLAPGMYIMNGKKFVVK